VILAALLLAASAAAEQWAAVATYDDTANSGAFIYGYATGELTYEGAINEAMRVCVNEGGRHDEAGPDEYGLGDPRKVCSVLPPSSVFWDAGQAGRKDTSPRGLTSYRAGAGPNRARLEQDLEADAEQRPEVAEREVLVLICSSDWAN